MRPPPRHHRSPSGLGSGKGLEAGDGVKAWRSTRAAVDVRLRRRAVELRAEARRGARRVVEGRLERAAEVAADQRVPGRDRLDGAAAAEEVEPAPADRDMADLV